MGTQTKIIDTDNGDLLISPTRIGRLTDPDTIQLLHLGRSHYFRSHADGRCDIYISHFPWKNDILNIEFYFHPGFILHRIFIKVYNEQYPFPVDWSTYSSEVERQKIAVMEKWIDENMSTNRDFEWGTIITLLGDEAQIRIEYKTQP